MVLLDLQIECQFYLGFKIRVIDLEESVHELAQIHVLAGVQVDH